MWHLVARTVRGRLLAADNHQAGEVWGLLRRVVPGTEAMCVMPDHVHVVVPSDGRRPLAAALSGLARSRNAREDRRGALFRPLPDAQPVQDQQKLRRLIRYIHLNPNRAGLANDPLEWPWSTHRDAVGLVWRGVGPRRRSGFHAYVSSDPHCDIAGTELPGGALGAKDPLDVVIAVSNVLRVPMERLGRHALGRSLVWEACCELCPVTTERVAGLLGVSGRTMRRRRAVPAELKALVQRVLLDDRFGPIDGRSLLGLPGWARYRRAVQPWR